MPYLRLVRGRVRHISDSLFLNYTDISYFINFKLLPELEEHRTSPDSSCPTTADYSFTKDWALNRDTAGVAKYFRSAWQYYIERRSKKHGSHILWDQFRTLLGHQLIQSRVLVKVFQRKDTNILSRRFELQNFDITSTPLETIDKLRKKLQATLKFTEELDDRYPAYKFQRRAMSFSADLSSVKADLQTLQVKLQDFANRRQSYMF